MRRVGAGGVRPGLILVLAGGVHDRRGALPQLCGYRADDRLDEGREQRHDERGHRLRHLFQQRLQPRDLAHRARDRAHDAVAEEQDRVDLRDGRLRVNRQAGNAGSGFGDRLGVLRCDGAGVARGVVVGGLLVSVGGEGGGGWVERDSPVRGCLRLGCGLQSHRFLAETVRAGDLAQERDERGAGRALGSAVASLSFGGGVERCVHFVDFGLGEVVGGFSYYCGYVLC